MSWFNVDDMLAFHPKVLDAGNAALGLWVRAGAWSKGANTGGEIPTAIIRTLGTQRQAAQLVAVGLWEKTAAGYQFHQWDDWQDSKEKVAESRALHRARQRRYLQARAAREQAADVAPELPRDSADVAPSARRDSAARPNLSVITSQGES